MIVKDDELILMGKLCKELAALDEQARRRVLTWLFDRFQFAGKAPPAEGYSEFGPLHQSQGA